MNEGSGRELNFYYHISNISIFYHTTESNSYLLVLMETTRTYWHFDTSEMAKNDSSSRNMYYSMSRQKNETEIHIPEDEEEVIEITDAETEQEKNLAIAQARLIGDI